MPCVRGEAVQWYGAGFVPRSMLEVDEEIARRRAMAEALAQMADNDEAPITFHRRSTAELSHPARSSFLNRLSGVFSAHAASADAGTAGTSGTSTPLTWVSAEGPPGPPDPGALRSASPPPAVDADGLSVVTLTEDGPHRDRGVGPRGGTAVEGRPGLPPIATKVGSAPPGVPQDVRPSCTSPLGGKGGHPGSLPAVSADPKSNVDRSGANVGRGLATLKASANGSFASARVPGEQPGTPRSQSPGPHEYFSAPSSPVGSPKGLEGGFGSPLGTAGGSAGSPPANGAAKVSAEAKTSSKHFDRDVSPQKRAGGVSLPGNKHVNGPAVVPPLQGLGNSRAAAVWEVPLDDGASAVPAVRDVQAAREAAKGGGAPRDAKPAVPGLVSRDLPAGRPDGSPNGTHRDPEGADGSVQIDVVPTPEKKRKVEGRRQTAFPGKQNLNGRKKQPASSRYGTWIPPFLWRFFASVLVDDCAE